MTYLKALFFLLVLCFTVSLSAQNEDFGRFDDYETQLDLLISASPGLEDPVDLSVSGVPLAEFIRALGNSNEVNLSVDPGVQGTVVNNFSNVSVSEVLIFLAKQYDLDLKFTGNIIHVLPHKKAPEPPKIAIPQPVMMQYDTASSLLTIELKRDSLPKVAKALTQNTSKNVVFEPGLENKLLSVYLEDVPFDQAMDKLAFANNLQISKTEDGFYLIQQPEPAKPDNQNRGGKGVRFLDLNEKSKAQFRLDSNLISLTVENEPLNQVVRNLFKSLGLDYYLYTSLNGTVTLKAEGVTLDKLLQKMFAGTPYTFRQKQNSFLLGERNMEGLREIRRINIYNRTVDKITEFIPSELKKGVEIKEFPELNSLLVSGSYPLIQELEEFIYSIDQPVPVVIIEVMIVDYSRTNAISNGIEAGVGEAPVESGGQVFPGIDYTLSSESINKLLESFDGFGSLNLGPVTPNFYLSLKLLETNGILNVRSTPKISTLNGHEAAISLGNTEYYVVEQTNITGVQNPIPITTRNYQSVQANFTLAIRPMVSADNQVTLEIDVEQSDFTARISPEAPPGTVSRKFTSLIRVKGGEMVLLGGLEEKGYDDSGSGFPVLSRIPIIKWFFSSRTRTENKTKLNVFIKPTILY